MDEGNACEYLDTPRVSSRDNQTKDDGESECKLSFEEASHNEKSNFCFTAVIVCKKVTEQLPYVTRLLPQQVTKCAI
jgi:hypothetical protein